MDRYEALTAPIREYLGNYTDPIICVTVGVLILFIFSLTGIIKVIKSNKLPEIIFYTIVTLIGYGVSVYLFYVAFLLARAYGLIRIYIFL